MRAMTLLEIRQAGLEALAERLGPVGMVRFLQQYGAGPGDHAVERHEWLDDVDVKTLATRIRKRRAPKQRGRPLRRTQSIVGSARSAVAARSAPEIASPARRPPARVGVFLWGDVGHSV